VPSNVSISSLSVRFCAVVISPPRVAVGHWPVSPTVDPAVAARRIDTRGTRHRFEAGSESSARAAELYADATSRLATLGYPLLTIDTTHLRPDQVVERIAARIADLTARPTTHAATA
jgi:hypothetical protein